MTKGNWRRDSRQYKLYFAYQTLFFTSSIATLEQLSNHLELSVKIRASDYLQPLRGVNGKNH